jgi:hypothetical protein
MKIKNILNFCDKIRTYIFPNVLVLYTYLQLLFLFVYFQINKNSIHLSQIDISNENLLDLSIIFVSFLISIFMICFCIIMVFIEYILRRQINLKLIKTYKMPISINLFHQLVFYMGVFIIIIYISYLLSKIFINQ